jgi:hypothetical protein
LPLSSLGPASIRLGFTFPVKLDGFRQPVRVPEDVFNLSQQILDDSRKATTTSEHFIILISNFRKAPIPFVRLILIKLCRVWYGSDTNNYDRYSFMVQALYLLLLGLSAYISAKNISNGCLLFQITIPSLIYFWLMTILGMPLLRYMVPAISLLFLFVPAFIQFIPSMLSIKKACK